MVNPLAMPGYKTAIQPDYGPAPRAMTPEERDVWEETHSIPYRGAVDHGLTHGGSVPSDLRKMGEDDGEELYSDDNVTYEQPEPVTPVPVRIVRDSEPGKELKMFRVFRAYASFVRATRIVSRADDRSKTTIRNMSADTIYVGHDESSASVWNGYPVAANAEWSTSSDQDVWAVSGGAVDAPLAVNVEYSAVNPG